MKSERKIHYICNREQQLFVALLLLFLLHCCCFFRCIIVAEIVALLNAKNAAFSNSVSITMLNYMF